MMGSGRAWTIDTIDIIHTIDTPPTGARDVARSAVLACE